MKKMIVVLILLLTPLMADTPKVAPRPTQSLDLKKVFASSPSIYSLLLIMSVSSVALWVYTLATFREKKTLPESFLGALEETLNTQNYDRALELCKENRLLLSSMVKAGLETRQHGAQVMMDAMKSEGRRASASFWQRLSLLNDIAIVAPMLGLLGTVIGMFYAFYDVNRSIESINALFDGLGIAIGTTVAGLVVAILSMIFATTLKYRLVKNLGLIENVALSLSSRIAIKDC